MAGALVRWSLWWPHRDMRLVYARGAAVVAVVVGLVGAGLLARVTVRADARGVLVVSVVSVLVTSVLGYEWLVAITARYR